MKMVNPPKNIEIIPIINSINPFNWFKVVKELKRKIQIMLFLGIGFLLWLPLGTIAKLLRKTTKIFAITDNVIPHEKRFGDYVLTKYFISKCDAFLTLSSSVLDDLKIYKI